MDYDEKATDGWFIDRNLHQFEDGETFYSWCARFHKLNVGNTSKATSNVLFGNYRAGLRHDIPSYLGEFQRRTGSALGDTNNLLRNYTIFGFHSIFLPQNLEKRMTEQLVVGDGNLVRKNLGFERSGLLSINPLKFCPECAQQQLEERGFSWWKMLQQLPTAFICTTHNLRLHCQLGGQYRGVFQDFHNPLELTNQHEPEIGVMSVSGRTQLIRLGIFGEQLHNSVALRVTDAKLRHCYLFKAKALGWLAFDGTVRMQQVRDHFINQYRDVFGFFGDQFFGELESANAGFLAYMFRKLPSRRHPLKHVVLMNFLYDSLDDFIEALSVIEVTHQEGGDEALEKLLRDGQTHLLKLVSTEGRSVSSAAKEIGISDTSAAKFLDREATFTRQRRPHIVGTEKEKLLKELLRKGQGRSVIAAAVGVRRSFIKDYLIKYPELKELWSMANRNCQRQLHRKQLLKVLKQHPDLPIKSIRRLPANGFQWLYVNDRYWLQEMLPAIWKR